MNINNKKRECEDWKNDKCELGNKCKYLHIKGRRGINSNIICKFINENKVCPHGINCDYKHPIDLVCTIINETKETKELNNEINNNDDNNDKFNFNNKTFKKRYICKHWMKGYCRLGDKCNFKHTNQEWNNKTELCPYYKANGCIYGSNCKYGLHTLGMARTAEKCFFWQNNKCLKGNKCLYLHD